LGIGKGKGIKLTTTLDLSQKAKRAGEEKKRFWQEGGVV